MSSETKIDDLFKKWNDLNSGVGVSMGTFDFDSLREVRAQQRALEDKIYSILLENAPDDIKKLLPEDCGEFEMGYNLSENLYYFLMYDPEEPEDSADIMAITIDADKNVKTIKNFKRDEEE